MKEQSLYDFEVKAGNGSAFSLKGLEEKVLLIVNTASKCGFTPQYKGLEELHRKYGDKGLVVLGFPCDQFAHQEPGSDEEIMSFCQINFGVTFPLMSKLLVNGPDAHPLFLLLRKRTAGILGDAIKWNFTKFLVSPGARRVKRYESFVTPEKLEADIEKMLKPQPTGQ
ncbi:MAG TPA: glutathione peroxidase [Rectinemataceae bacterium]|nr:glutathione peroxidase [Rectinemataceae bacterium]